MSAEFGFRPRIAFRSSKIAETGDATHREQPTSPATPSGVLTTYGALWVLLGSVALYWLGRMEADQHHHHHHLRSSMMVLQYAAWTIGCWFVSIAGYRSLRQHGRQSAADD